tara:strand:- start:690 stop:863 length:174 start_codon:yes stop_codon:yes gene_type:complete
MHKELIEKLKQEDSLDFERLDDFPPNLSEDNQSLEDYLDEETAKEIELERQQVIEGT